MLICFGKKILTVEYSPVKNLMLQFGHGNNMRFQKVQVNNHFSMYKIFVHIFFANVNIFFNKKNFFELVG